MDIFYEKEKNGGKPDSQSFRPTIWCPFGKQKDNQGDTEKFLGEVLDSIPTLDMCAFFSAALIIGTIYDWPTDFVFSMLNGSLAIAILQQTKKIREGKFCEEMDENGEGFDVISDKENDEINNYEEGDTFLHVYDM